MTANQIQKRLTKNNLSLNNITIQRDMIEVCVGYEERNGFGMSNTTKTKKLSNQVKKLFPEYSYSSQTGYGAILIWFNHKPCPFAAQNID